MVKDLDDFAPVAGDDASENITDGDTAYEPVRPEGIMTGTEVADTEYDDLSEYFNPADIGMLDFDAAKTVERSPSGEGEARPSSDPSAEALIPDEALSGALTGEEPEGPDGEEDTAPGEEAPSRGKKPKREKKARKKKDEAADENGDGQAKTKSDRRSGATTVVLWILIAVLLGAIAFGAVKLLPMFRKDDSLKVIRAGDTVSNGTVEVTFDEVNVLGSMLTYQFDPDYVYISVMYTFRNVSDQEQTWEITPYIMLKPFSLGSDGTVSPLDPEGEEAAELLEIASKLAPAESFILPVEDTTQETAGEGQGDEASEEEQQEDPLKGLYGVYDFNALQIYSLEKCIEYSTVKDNIPPGGERISADVIKIPRQLFETGKYYLCMDNQKAAVYIDPTPVDIDAEPASDAPENAPQEGSSEEEGGED